MLWSSFVSLNVCFLTMFQNGKSSVHYIDNFLNFWIEVGFFCRSQGGSYLGDVNISAILDSFGVSYDKRVRPNYGGEC